MRVGFARTKVERTAAPPASGRARVFAPSLVLYFSWVRTAGASRRAKARYCSPATSAVTAEAAEARLISCPPDRGGAGWARVSIRIHISRAYAGNVFGARRLSARPWPHPLFPAPPGALRSWLPSGCPLSCNKSVPTFGPPRKSYLPWKGMVDTPFRVVRDVNAPLLHAHVPLPAPEWGDCGLRWRRAGWVAAAASHSEQTKQTETAAELGHRAPPTSPSSPRPKTRAAPYQRACAHARDAWLPTRSGRYPATPGPPASDVVGATRADRMSDRVRILYLLSCTTAGPAFVSGRL